jgi:hypothetical protein
MERMRGFAESLRELREVNSFSEGVIDRDEKEEEHQESWNRSGGREQDCQSNSKSRNQLPIETGMTRQNCGWNEF